MAKLEQQQPRKSIEMGYSDPCSGPLHPIEIDNQEMQIANAFRKG